MGEGTIDCLKEVLAGRGRLRKQGTGMKGRRRMVKQWMGGIFDRNVQTGVCRVSRV